MDSENQENVREIIAEVERRIENIDNKILQYEEGAYNLDDDIKFMKKSELALHRPGTGKY